MPGLPRWWLQYGCRELLSPFSNHWTEKRDETKSGSSTRLIPAGAKARNLYIGLSFARLESLAPPLKSGGFHGGGCDVVGLPSLWLQSRKEMRPKVWGFHGGGCDVVGCLLSGYRAERRLDQRSGAS